MECKLCITNGKNKDVVNQCEKIAVANYFINGGTLHYTGLTSESDYLIYVKNKDEKVISYLSLVKNYFEVNDIYVYQIAVDNNFKNQGLGSLMYNYLFTHAKGFVSINSNVRTTNVASISLHEKFNMKKSLMPNNKEYIYTKSTAELGRIAELPEIKNAEEIELATFKINNKINDLEI